MSYKIAGGPDDGKRFNITLKRCTDDQWKKFHNVEKLHPSERLFKLKEAHRSNDAFFCPDAFDLSFWGVRGDFDSKTLVVDFEYVSEESLEGKDLLLLLNNKKTNYEEDYRHPVILPHTSMHWLPLSSSSPQQTIVTYTRERVYDALTEWEKLLGTALRHRDFLSARESRFERKAYSLRKTNPKVAASLVFQLSHDLLVESPRDNQNRLAAFELAGGVYILLTVVVGFVFSRLVPYFLHLHVIRHLFKVDNNRQSKPQSLAKLDNKNHSELVREAKSAHSKRVKLTTNACDSCMLIFESVLRLLTCGMNRWSRTVKEGTAQIKDELNIFNYMRRLRMTQATVNALTTFN